MGDIERMGIRFRSVRRHLDFSQVQLADEFSVREATIIRWEGGKNYPSTDALLKLLELEPRLDPGWLLTGRGEMLKVEIPEIKIEQCVNCVYWQESKGKCRKDAPVFTKGEFYGVWPSAMESDWCGAYKERE